MRQCMHTLIMLVLISIAGCSQGGEEKTNALADTPENREMLVTRYCELNPMESIANEMCEEMASRLPPEDSEQFRAFWVTFMTEDVLGEIEDAAKTSLATHFTVDELQAYIRLMEDPAGRSAIAKMKYYMADLMPLVQKHALRAAQEYQTRKTDD